MFSSTFSALQVERNKNSKLLWTIRKSFSDMHFQYRYKRFRVDESLYQIHLQNGRQESQVDQKVKKTLVKLLFLCVLWGSKEEQNITRGPQEKKVCLILSVSVITIAFYGDHCTRTNFWPPMCGTQLRVLLRDRRIWPRTHGTRQIILATITFNTRPVTFRTILCRKLMTELSDGCTYTGT